MPILTRRGADTHRESWTVYYGDVPVGTIGCRSGVPVQGLELRLCARPQPRSAAGRISGNVRTGARHL
jgi:hypothetical protein